MKSLLRSLLGRVLIGWLLLVGAFSSTQLSYAQSAPLNETIYIDQIVVDPATGQRTQIVLSDGGVGNQPLQDLLVAFLLSEDNTILVAYPLTGGMTNAEGFFTLGGPSDSDLAVDLSGLQSADAVAIYEGEISAFAAGSRVADSNAIDLVLFALADNNELLALRPPLPATATLAEAALPAATTRASACNDAAVPIHSVQGADDISPRLGEVVAIQGIVVGDFQDVKTQLRGFFVQEEATDQDDDPATSEGIFVLDNGFKVDVMPGDLVRVRGLVHEFNTMTELKRLESVYICERNRPLEPVLVTLPETENGDLERYEGMLIRIANEMTVAQTYFLGRYGQMTLAAPATTGRRTYQPTTLFPPDTPEAKALAEENARRLLVLDDGRDLSALGDNPNPVPYLGDPPPAVIRAGDTVTNLVGVLDFGRINSAPGNEAALDYRLHPMEAPMFTAANPRTTTPPTVMGDLRVVGFNVLNYFNGDGQGGGYPTARGAKTAAEFERQRDKVIAALLALDADVIGLMEIENDGYGINSAIQDLVTGLNETQPDDVAYAFIDPRLPRLGGDAIAVGLLYRTMVITPTGPAMTLDTGAFDQTLADEGRSRQPLVQTFVDGAGERFTVVVNHFKSKRPGEMATGGNVDSGNGTGGWNERRTEAAQDLVTWLATDPTNSGDPDVLIIGDLNAYAK